MDSNTKTHKQIDDRGENDLERIIEEQINHILILEEKLEQTQKQLAWLQQQIRKYSGKEDI